MLKHQESGLTEIVHLFESAISNKTKTEINPLILARELVRFQENKYEEGVKIMFDTIHNYLKAIPPKEIRYRPTRIRQQAEMKLEYFSALADDAIKSGYLQIDNSLWYLFTDVRLMNGIEIPVGKVRRFVRKTLKYNQKEWLN